MAKTTISKALKDLLLDDTLSVDEAVDKHFHPDFRLRNGKETMGRAEFAQHMALLRGLVGSGSVNVHQELVDGLRYAEHHTLDGVKKDGGRVTIEVFTFGSYAEDGRFKRLDEATEMIVGDAADQELTTAR